MNQTIIDYQRGLVETLNRLSDREIGRFADDLYACYRRQGTVFIVGNGGSAATASHFACDLMKGTRGGGMPTFRVICPTDSVPGMTAWSNDVSYACALAEHVAAFVTERDVLIAISTSGNSRNVLEAVEVARRSGARTLALTGRSGGELATMVDFALHTSCDLIEQVEDLHLIVAHCLCVTLRERIQKEEAVDRQFSGVGSLTGLDGQILHGVAAPED